MSDIGQYIKSKRLEKKLSIRKASEQIGISHTYLDSLEKGIDPRTNKKRTPTTETLRKIADGLDISYIELLKKAGHIDMSEFQELLDTLRTIYELASKNMDLDTKGEVESTLLAMGRLMDSDDPKEFVNRLLDMKVLVNNELINKTSIFKKTINKDDHKNIINLPTNGKITYNNVTLSDQEVATLYDFIELMLKNRKD